VIGQIVSAALWAVLASLVLSLAIGAAVGAIIHFARPAAATRQALWSIALGAAGLAPVVILAVMLIRGATGSAAANEVLDAVPIAAPLAGHPERSRGAVPNVAIGAVPQRARDDQQHAPAAKHGSALHVPPPPDLAPLAAQGIVIAWALGALAGLTGLGRSLVRVRGLKLRSSALEGDLATELPWLTTMPGREIYLRLSYETETPIAVGFRRPVILIPTEMATADGLTSIEPLVMHEYAHLARYDDLTNLIQRAIERVFWFNPLVWILGRRLALEREVAADEAVVARTHDAKNYATALWRMAQEMRMPEHVVVAPGAMLTRRQISVRIERLLDDSPAAGRRFGAAAFAAAALTLTGVAGVAATAPPIVLANATPAAPATPEAVHAAAPPVTHVAAHPSHIAAPLAGHLATPSIVRMLAQANPTVSPSASPSPSPATHAAVPLAPPHAVPAQPETPPMPARPSGALVDPDAIASGILSDAEMQNLKGLGDRIKADVARRLADQHMQSAEQHRQTADQRRRLAQNEIPAGPLTRELVAACAGCDFSGRNLKGLNLSALNLTGNDFSRATLDGVNFGRATLRGCSFSHASLAGAQFTAAKLTGVDFNHANLNGTNFTNAFLTGTDLSHATMDGAVTTGIRLIGSALP
jgi:beta-lactamase regulating signal transducer with metallopeptidase domain